MVKSYIIKKHMLPVPLRKSFYLTSDLNCVKNMILQTVENPDRKCPHRDDSGKTVYFKKYPNEIGIHGIRRTYCKTMVVVVRNWNNKIITAYPTD